MMSYYFEVAMHILVEDNVKESIGNPSCVNAQVLITRNSDLIRK